MTFFRRFSPMVEKISGKKSEGPYTFFRRFPPTSAYRIEEVEGPLAEFEFQKTGVSYEYTLFNR